MHKKDAIKSPFWVDIFTESDFQGRMTRVRCDNHVATRYFDGKQSPPCRSLIVGPQATAEFRVRLDSPPIRVSPRSFLPDTTCLAEGIELHYLRVEKTELESQAEQQL